MSNLGVVLCAVSVLCAGCNAREGVAESKQRLTVEETVGLVYCRFMDTYVAHYYARANPEAKKIVYGVLEDETLQEYHANAWKVIGRIADTRDARRIEQAIEHLKSTPRRLTSTEKSTLSALFDCVGIACGRDVEGACELAYRIQDPEYWRDAEFLKHVPRNTTMIGEPYQTLARAMRGYALSLKPDVTERARIIVERAENAADRETLEWALSRDRLLGGARTARAREDKPVTAEERRMLRSCLHRELHRSSPQGGPAAAKEGPPKISDPSARQLLDLAERFQLGADGQITYLTFVGETVTDTQMALLDSVPDLRTLSLAKTAVTDDGLKHLANLKRLERLTISRSQRIGDAGLRHVASLTTLTALDLLYLPKIGDEGLTHLGTLKRLERLELNSGGGITDEGLKQIGQLASLKWLTLRNLPKLTDDGLKHLEPLENLESLVLRTAKLTVECLQHVRAIKGLKMLSAQFHSGSGPVAY